MNQVLSPEEVAALFQGLTATETEPQAGPGVFPGMAGASPSPLLRELKPGFRPKMISSWLTRLTEWRWPRL